MGYLETLIYLRVSFILNEITEYFSELLNYSVYEVVDVELCTYIQQFYHQFDFRNDWSLILYERYTLKIIDWKLQNITMLS